MLALLCPTLFFGQGETNNWYFGNGAGIQFNPDGSVTGLTDGQIDTIEGCATISDPLGNLLFYTDGITVYDRNHQVMENGRGLYGDPSSTQSALIVPRPGSPIIYYIFTVDTSVQQGDVDNGLNYSVVDISMNSGAGAITQKNIRLLGDCSEKITAVLRDCSDQSIWLITLADNNGGPNPFNTYHAFEISTTGVATTSIRSTFPDLAIQDARGNLKVSPDGTKIVSANGDFGLYSYDFDAATGQLSNQERISISAPHKVPYGVEFSPNGQFLYVHASNDLLEATGHFSNLLQYDMLSQNISASEVILDSRPLYRGGLQLADNGKIYRTISQNYFIGTSYLGVINNPNVKGVASNYQHNAISLNGRVSGQGLPPFIQSFFSKIDLILNPDGSTASTVSLCGNESLVLQTELIPGATYFWEKDGVPFENLTENILEIQSTDADDSGRYRLSITTTDPSECPIIGEATVTIEPIPEANNIELVQCDVDIQNSTDGLTVMDLKQVEQNPDVTYLYYETIADMENNTPIQNPQNYGNTNSFDQIIYYRVVNNLGCGNSGEIAIHVQPIVFNGPENTFYSCDEDATDNVLIGIFDLEEIKNTTYPDSEVSFYSSLEDVSLEKNELLNLYATESETVYVRLENANQCQDVLEISLMVNPTPLFSLEPSYLICTDNPSLTIDAPEGFDIYTFYKIVGSSEELISTTQQIEIFEIGQYALDVGYTYNQNGNTTVCESRFEFTVLPSNIAIIEDLLVADFSDNNTVQIEVSGDGDYEFSLDGENYQEPNFFENVPAGLSTVFVRDKNGCGISEELISVLGYPKFFTPNNDGYNDTWQLIGIDDRFQGDSFIAIYDRFGKQMAQIGADGTGWNGTYNGTMLPSSDYWFKVSMANGREFKGHFTLKDKNIDDLLVGKS